jgi:sulfur carrier protein ThiS
MPTVTLAPAIARWLSADPQSRGEFRATVAGDTVRQLLDAIFVQYPHLRDYIVDERGTLRHHVVAFVNNEPVRDKQSLDHAVPPDGELYLFQALSGG